METDIAKNGMNINNTSLDGYVKGNVVSLNLVVFILPRSLVFYGRKILSALLLQIVHVL